MTKLVLRDSIITAGDVLDSTAIRGLCQTEGRVDELQITFELPQVSAEDNWQLQRYIVKGMFQLLAKEGLVKEVVVRGRKEVVKAVELDFQRLERERYEEMKKSLRFEVL